MKALNLYIYESSLAFDTPPPFLVDFFIHVKILAEPQIREIKRKPAWRQLNDQINDKKMIKNEKMEKNMQWNYHTHSAVLEPV